MANVDMRVFLREIGHVVLKLWKDFFKDVYENSSETLILFADS